MELNVEAAIPDLGMDGYGVIYADSTGSLTDTVDTISALVLDRRISPARKVDDVVGRG
jgi:hypothetical protein